MFIIIIIYILFLTIPFFCYFVCCFVLICLLIWFCSFLLFHFYSWFCLIVLFFICSVVCSIVESLHLFLPLFHFLFNTSKMRFVFHLLVVLGFSLFSPLCVSLALSGSVFDCLCFSLTPVWDNLNRHNANIIYHTHVHARRTVVSFPWSQGRETSRPLSVSVEPEVTTLSVSRHREGWAPE